MKGKVYFTTPLSKQTYVQELLLKETEDSMEFVWGLDHNVTREAGEVKFIVELHIEIAPEIEDDKTSPEVVWMLNTLPASFTVHQREVGDMESVIDPSKTVFQRITDLENTIVELETILNTVLGSDYKENQITLATIDAKAQSAVTVAEGVKTVISHITNNADEKDIENLPSLTSLQNSLQTATKSIEDNKNQIGLMIGDTDIANTAVRYNDILRELSFVSETANNLIDGKNDKDQYYGAIHNINQNIATLLAYLQDFSIEKEESRETIIVYLESFNNGFADLVDSIEDLLSDFEESKTDFEKTSIKNLLADLKDINLLVSGLLSVLRDENLISTPSLSELKKELVDFKAAYNEKITAIESADSSQTANITALGKDVENIKKTIFSN